VWFAEDLSGGHDAHLRAGQRWHGGDQVTDAIGLAGNEFVELGAIPDQWGLRHQRRAEVPAIRGGAPPC
jgi:hypothetical protein